MEEIQKRVIVENLDNLIRLTNCSTIFLSYLSSEQILTEADVQLVNSRCTQLSKSTCLYDILLTRQGSYDTLVLALQNTRQTGALEVLNSEVNVVKANSNNKLLWNIPDPLTTFQGRVSELWELHSMINFTNLVTSSSYITLVHGAIGVGKTEICIQYLHNIKKWNSNLCDHALFFRCHNVKTIEEDVNLISQTLFGYNYPPTQIENMVEDIFYYVAKNKPNCFFLYDGCNDPSLLRIMIPKSFKNLQNEGFSCPKIIITSQISNLDTSIKNRLHLNMLKPLDAFLYASKRLGKRKYCTKALQGLCNKLQNHPLALENATSYILKQQFLDDNFQDFVNQFDYSIEPFSKRYEQLERTYPQPFALAWRNSLEILKQQQTHGLAAINVLQYIAYIGCSQNSFQFLKLIFSDQNLHDAKQILAWYNILSYNKYSNKFEILDIIRLFVRNNLEDNQSNLEVLKTIMAKLADLDEPKEDVFYEAWKHACRHASIANRYFACKKLYGMLITPLHIFVKENDFIAVRMLFKSFSNNGRIKNCSELRIRIDQKQIILELKKHNLVLKPCGDVYVWMIHKPCNGFVYLTRVCAYCWFAICVLILVHALFYLK